MIDDATRVANALWPLAAERNRTLIDEVISGLDRLVDLRRVGGSTPAIVGSHLSAVGTPHVPPGPVAIQRQLERTTVEPLTIDTVAIRASGPTADYPRDREWFLDDITKATKALIGELTQKTIATLDRQPTALPDLAVPTDTDYQYDRSWVGDRQLLVVAPGDVHNHLSGHRLALHTSLQPFDEVAIARWGSSSSGQSSALVSVPRLPIAVFVDDQDTLRWHVEGADAVFTCRLRWAVRALPSVASPLSKAGEPTHQWILFN